MTARVAILGAGVMGETLLASILRSGVPAANVVISEKRAERAAELEQTYGVAVLSNADAVDGADIVLVVVKPQDVAAVIAEITPRLKAEATVVSLAAGIRIDTYEQAFADGIGVVRAMPNTPALIGAGMFGISAGAAVSEQRLTQVQQLLSTGGEVVVVDESDQDAVTGVSGSGPAYVFYLAEAMIAGGVEAGLDPEVARTLATQTVLGAARLLAESDATAEELRHRVTSPHGTTHAAITTLEEHEVKAAVVAAIASAAARSAELSGPS